MHYISSLITCQRRYIDMKKLLVIKTGESETLNELQSSFCSLGDVVRHFTFLDHIKELFSNYKIYWLTDPSAIPLFSLVEHNIEIITSIKSLDLSSVDILNFEKDKKYLEIVSRSKKDVYGFLYKEDSLKLRDISGLLNDFQYEPNYEVSFEKEMEEKFKLLSKKNDLPDTVQKISVVNDIGLNWKSGKKWPQKVLPKKFWNNIDKELSKSMYVSWQRGFNDLIEYINWIASCRVVITLDSLGLHIAELMEKEVVALFGPTNDEQVYLRKGVKLKYSNDIDKLLEKVLFNINKINEKN